ncbi:MAG: S1 RNA-binding domain-containing protein, partial [Ruminococcus sp.]|nr:S1 RNA-binding domain-containing protein [Ruminococcus sp.]
DGLVHISQITNKYIKHPLDAIKVGEIVKVRVLEVDAKRKRISLTMRLEDETPVEKPVKKKFNKPAKKPNDAKSIAQSIKNSGFKIKSK